MAYDFKNYSFPGKNAEAVGENCLLCGLALLVPILDIIAPAMIRQKIREQQGIEGSFIGDILLHWCCMCCALVQEAQEINSFGKDAMAIERE